jgi:hypothetical protein
MIFIFTAAKYSFKVKVMIVADVFAVIHTSYPFCHAEQSPEGG